MNDMPTAVVATDCSIPDKKMMCKKRVTFNEDEQVYEIEHVRSSMSRRRRKQVWYSDDEFLVLRDERQKELAEVYQCQDGFDIFAYRGLELVDYRCKMTRMKQTRMARHAVLSKQAEGVYDPIAISESYQSIAKSSTNKALHIASIDREAVVEYLSSTCAEIETLNCAEAEKKHQKGNRMFGTKSLKKMMLRVL